VPFDYLNCGIAALPQNVGDDYFSGSRSNSINSSGVYNQYANEAHRGVGCVVLDWRRMRRLPVLQKSPKIVLAQKTPAAITAIALSRWQGWLPQQ